MVHLLHCIWYEIEQLTFFPGLNVVILVRTMDSIDSCEHYLCVSVYSPSHTCHNYTK